MITVDTSVLVRYLTNDEPAEAAAAAQILDGEDEVAIPALVLLEAVHVLRGSPYRRRNPDFADALVELLARENVRLAGVDAELAGSAIAGVRHLSPRHMADALIAASAREAGATLLVTGDEQFASSLLPIRSLRSPGPGGRVRLGGPEAARNR